MRIHSNPFLRLVIGVAAVALAVALAPVEAARAAGDFLASVKADELDAGISVTQSASTDDIGLPAYPGAVLVKEGDDSPAATVGVWGGPFGLHLGILHMAVNARAEDVAAWYRSAMGRYGDVLDCSDPKTFVRNEGDHSLMKCERDDRRHGRHTLKVGSAHEVRIVTIRDESPETRFALLRLRLQGV